MSVDDNYIHGYGAGEGERLVAQASAVSDLLHRDTSYPSGARVLEIGCGTGAQTVTLARRSPGARFVSVDRSEESLDVARERVSASGSTNVELLAADLFDLPLDKHSFDHAFVCFVLEHLPDPRAALRETARYLKPGGSITLFEGDHGSTLFHPDNAAARLAVAAQVELQRRLGGNADIGRQLYPLLRDAGFQDVRVTPRMVYVDGSVPELADGFTRATFTAMIASVRDRAIAEGIIDARTFDDGVQGLERAAEADGVFCYTFFKGVGRLPIG